ncbi:MAG: diguanylate cyclase [Thermodesulfobacteriota bacterium]|nr:diguanylate cyclase [Thermodesulfobacteriota bacterium]
MKLYLKAICLFFAVLLLLGSLIWTRYQKLSVEHLKMREATFINTVNSINHTFRLVSETIADEILRQDDILKLIHHIVTTTDDTERNHSRGLLYRKLSPMYQRVSQHSVRQLHFHFPDNRSMLRFHKPNRADDNLIAARPSVKMVNELHHEVHGYESGRIVHGFRHVYPLAYQGVAIGSVEISNSFQQLRHELIEYEETSYTDYLFIMLKSDLWHKLASGQQELYTSSPLSNNYVCENTHSSSYKFLGGTAKVSNTLKQLQQQITDLPKLTSGMASKNDFTIITNWNKQLYAILFHSIKDVSGKHAAYIISIQPEPHLQALRISAITQFLIAALLTLFLVIYRMKCVSNQQKRINLRNFLQNVTNNIGEGLYTTDKNGTVTLINPEASRLLGYLPEEVVGKDAHSMFHSDDEHHRQHGCVILNTIINNATYRQQQAVFTHKNQHEFPVELTCTPIVKLGKITGSITMFHDITQRRKQEEKLKSAQENLRKANLELEKLAKIDGLTGVANRREFDQTIIALWKVAHRRKTALACLMIDIDYFKAYNDTYGHSQGDDCLRQIAHIIQQSCLRPDDFIARYGGEEFVVLLPKTGHADASRVAERIRNNVYQAQIPHAGSLSQPTVTLSVGVCSLHPENLTAAQELIDCADRSLYTAKSSGRNQVCSHD